MKTKIILFMVFVMTMFSANAQSISVTSIPSSTQAGTNLTVNYKYTAASAGKVSIVVTKNGGVNPWDYISTVVFDQLDPAVAGTDVTGSFTVAIPANTTPTAALTGNENYRVTLELKDATDTWLAGDYSNTNYNITAIPAISVTSIPSSTQAGTNLTVNYKYTAASAGKVYLVVSKNGGVNPWDYISTVVADQLDPATAGIDVTGSFTVAIPANTIPTAALSGNENYRVTLELKDASNTWLAGDYSTINYSITPPPPSISVTSIPSSTQAGTNLTVNYKYTSASASKVSIVVTKNGGVNPWDYISTVVFDQLDPAVAGVDNTGTFNVLIPANTTPTAGLTGNENYRVTLELKDATDTWLAGDYSNTNYNITAIPAISVTSIPSNTQVGTNLTVNYKYTAPSAGKVYIVVTKNGGVNPWDYISTVAASQLVPASAGIDVTGTFNVLIPSSTTPTIALTGNENYRVALELKDASDTWLAGDYSNIDYNISAVPAISVTSIPTRTLAGTNLTVNYKYTSSSAGKVSIVVSKNGGVNPWDYISTVVYDQLNPAVAGVDVTGTFNVLIPDGTTPTSALTGNENYRVTLELKDASDTWLAGDYSKINYTIIGPSVTVTSLPSSTLVGTNLTVNYKYTAAAAGKVSIVVSKNGGVNPWDYISTVVFDQLDPAVAGTDVTGTFTVPIWSGTTPTSALTGNENYRITLELKDASGNWLAGDYSKINYNFTGPYVGVTSIPTSVEAGSNLKVNYKYTAASAGKVSIVVTKNGGTNPWDYISTVVYKELTPAKAGSNVKGTFTVAIPANTTASSALTGNENYRITLELKDAGDNWLAGDYSKINYTITEPITEIRPMQCGQTLASLNTAIQASPIPGVEEYTFEVTRTDNNVVDIVTSPVYYFYPAAKIAGGLVYGKSYSIRAKVKVAGSYQPYGGACVVTAPSSATALSTTQIRSFQCGKTLSYLNSRIEANPLAGAVQYEFEVTPAGGAPTLVLSSQYHFSLYSISGEPQYNKQYSIRVRAFITGGIGWTAYGSTCTVTTPPAPISRMSSSALTTTFEVSAFPNPFASHFSLDIQSSSDDLVEVKVYDMIGRELENQKASVSELSTKEIGVNYPSGVYNVIVSQGDKVRSVRMVKR